MIKMSINGYVRISKTEAKKRYANNEDVYITADNLRPGHGWYPEVKMIPYNEIEYYPYEEPSINAAFEKHIDYSHYYSTTKKPLLYWKKEGNKNGL